MSVDPRFGVYVDSETARSHFNQIETVYPDIRFPRPLFCRDLEQYESNQYCYRVAAFHVPFPQDTGWLERLDRAYTVSDHIFVFCSELHEPIVEQLVNLDRNRISIYISGRIYKDFQHARIGRWMDWFHTSSEFYARTNPGFLDTRIQPYQTKPKAFDVLLGCQRSHRDFVYNYITNQNLQDRCVLTYIR